MAYEGWLEFDGVELVNMARTTQLARALNVTVVHPDPEKYIWLEERLHGISGFGRGGFGGGGFGGGANVHYGFDTLGFSEGPYGGTYEDIPIGGDYHLVENAPWYDPEFPASSEFIGIVPLSVQGLDDSTLESTPVEYITDGGHSGKARNATLAIVANAVLVGSTERGVTYGKAWLDRVLRGDTASARMFCSGGHLYYFSYADLESPRMHRRDVRLTRGTSVTRKRSSACAAMWTVTFTLTAADPFEYGEMMPKVYRLGAATPEGSGVQSFGTLIATETTCPVWDYTPIYDPLHPALVPSPTAPDLATPGWGIAPGDSFQRRWVRVSPVEPSGLLTVPVIELTTEQDARMVRVSVWPGDAPDEAQCEPLFSAIVTYLPAGMKFYIDGEQKAAYVWDGLQPVVRRTDSLVYAPGANPVEWTAFNDHDGLLVTLDTFAAGGGYQGGGTIRASLALVPKSD